MGQYSEDGRVDGILQAVAAFKKNAPQNYLDAAYGANRALNGASFGGLDHLGDRYGFDSRMNGYLSLLSPQERLLREGLSGALQTGGAMLPIARLWQGLRVPFNVWQIGRAYDRLKQNPFQGSGQDVIARMKNHNGETVVLQRGEAIRGANGNIKASGKELFRRTGTERNYGLNKAIYKHDVPREQVTRIPKTIKGKPLETTDFGQDVYMYKTRDGNYRVVTSSTPKGKTVSSIYKIER